MITGQLVESGRRWYAELRNDGTVTFQTTTGNRLYGRFTIRGDAVCFEYNADEKEHCRSPRQVGSEVRWYDENNEFVSHVVSVGSDKLPPAAPRIASVAEHIKGDRCALIVSSQRTVNDARAYIRENVPRQNRTYAMGYRSNNGWIAVSVGTLAPHEVHPILSEWKSNRRIPRDSLCSHGHRYIDVVEIKN